MTEKQFKEKLEAVKHGDWLNERKVLDYGEIVHRLELQLKRMYELMETYPNARVYQGAAEQIELDLHYLYNMVQPEPFTEDEKKYLLDILGHDKYLAYNETKKGTPKANILYDRASNLMKKIGGM